MSFNTYFVFSTRFCSQNLNWVVPYFKDLLTAAAMVRRELITLKLHAWQTMAEKLRLLREMRGMNSSVGCQSFATFLSSSINNDLFFHVSLLVQTSRVKYKYHQVISIHLYFSLILTNFNIYNIEKRRKHPRHAAKAGVTLMSANFWVGNVWSG